jgi:hypothetical protein
MELTQSVEPTLESILSPLVAARTEAKQKIAALEKAVDNINDSIKTALVHADTLEVVVDGQRVTLDLEREKSSLNVQRLLELGVSTEVIQKATKVTTHMQLDVRKAAKAAE